MVTPTITKVTVKKTDYYFRTPNMHLKPNYDPDNFGCSEVTT
jgi:hypothetical protein